MLLIGTLPIILINLSIKGVRITEYIKLCSLLLNTTSPIITVVIFSYISNCHKDKGHNYQNNYNGNDGGCNLKSSHFNPSFLFVDRTYLRLCVCTVSSRRALQSLDSYN